MRVERVEPEPTDEEMAAIVAAISVVEAQRAMSRRPGDDQQLNMWIHASRRAAQRAGMQRGPWRMSGRLPRRSRT